MVSSPPVVLRITLVCGVAHICFPLPRLSRSLKQAEDAGAYLELLLPSYKALPENCIQKAR